MVKKPDRKQDSGVLKTIWRNKKMVKYMLEYD